jgi:ferrochelatase
MPSTELPPHDAVLIVGFGGPEGPDDVMPFLENVTRGRNIPRERLLEVAEHYHHFGGVSPINAQVRELIAALEPELRRQGVDLPLYWGNRNWAPMLPDAVKAMTEAGSKHALAVVLAAYSSYSSCRQYREDVERARQEVGPDAPVFDKMRVYFNHPDFVAANADRVADALNALNQPLRAAARVAFTAHSIPSSMAATCNYEIQLREACRLVAEALGIGPDRWSLVYQSRSGRPQDPWLEPDILDHIRAIHADGAPALVVHPIGFLSDHMEVLYDLDEEARLLCDELGLPMARSATVGTHPRFVAMLAELIRERVTGSPDRRAIGAYGPNHDVCPVDCCLPPKRPGGPPSPSASRG